MADPFRALGLPATMKLSDDQIEGAALLLSARLHPDAGADDVQAQGRLAEINDARATLSNPETRASALLALLGGPAASADRTLPAGFLPEMMEIREKIEEAQQSKDQSVLAGWVDWAMQRRARHAEEVTRLLDDGHDPQRLRQVRHELNAWRYIERLIEQIGQARTL
ncbi:MAG: DnaJ domain-containing protein [Phycisphaerales bacterium]|nr:DnaJ domain-containing protein [Phycisphaerales bacterium]